MMTPSSSRLREQIVVGAALGLGAGRPRIEVDDALHPGLAQLLETAEARAQRRVAVPAVERVAQPGRLQNRVLLGVHADAHVVGRAARILVAMGAAVAALLLRVAAQEPARRAVVARRDDAALAHDHGTDVAPEALGALARRDRDEHEVLVPVGPAAAASQIGLTRIAAHPGKSRRVRGISMMARMGREIHARETRFGRYFEEFELGDVYHHWPGKTITEAEDHLFCLITMNHHPLHSDAHYAETETQFGRNVVVGNLVYSLVLGMSVPDVSGKAIANLEIESLRHARPTFHGDTIYARTTVLDKRESQSKPDRGIVTVETVGWNQREETVCEFRRRVLVPKRPLPASP